MCHSILGLALAFLCLPSLAFGQGEAAKPRLKIGLALSGGAALGLAHIGVLEWFEKHHIPIDCLAGTSMGGLVGGCYCMGMTPEEMRALLKSIEWNDALRVGPAYQTLNLRRKEDERAVASRLVIGLRHGAAMPEGLTPGNSIGLLLSRICLPYSEIHDFDALPTPFRCMATDLNKGEAIILKDGPLETALRATMALPALFTPVERDGRLLVDGGALNNTPTEAVKEMGADIIIAVDLSASFFDQKQAGSLVDILGRTINVMTYSNERRSLKLADIILTPELVHLTGMDFVRVDAFAEKGYQAAEDKARILERFALNNAEWEVYTAQRNARKRTAVSAPTLVQTEGANGKTAQSLQARLQSFAHTPLNATRLEKELTTITGEGRFESFQYRQIHRNGEQGLLVSVHEKRYGPPMMRFGLEIDGADTQNIRTNFAARLIALDAGIPGAEVRADLRLGSDKEAALEYYRPLNRDHRWFVAPRLFYSDTSLDLYHQSARVASYGNRSAGAGLDLGLNTGRSSELRLGYQYHHQSASVRIGSPLLPSLFGDVSMARLQWTYDGQDSPMIPSRGNRLQVNARWYFTAPGAPGSYPAAEARLSSFHPMPRGDSLFSVLAAGTTFGNQAAPVQQFTAGGPLRLGAYGLDEFRGNDFLNVTLGHLHRLFQLPSFLGGKVMAGSWYEFGGAFQRFGHARYQNDLSIGLVAETLVGPMVIGYSYGESGRNSLYFSIGRLF